MAVQHLRNLIALLYVMTTTGFNQCDCKVFKKKKKKVTISMSHRERDQYLGIDSLKFIQDANSKQSLIFIQVVK